MADDVYHQILGAIQTTNSKIDSLNAVALGSSAASNRFKWTVNGTVFNTSRGGLAWIAAYAVAILADIQSYTKSSSTSLSNLVSYATSVASDGNYYSFTKYLNMIYYQQQKQWGYGYGGTAVITNNSPASWLQTLSSNSVSTASDGKSYSFAKYLNMINSHMGDLVTNVGWPYNGTSVTGFLNVINTEANNQSKTLEAIRKLLLSQNQNDEDWSVTKYANSINDKMGQLLENVGWPHDGMSVTGFLDSILSALDKGGSWSESDKGALFAKLDGISDRLSIEAGKTVLDTIFGDMSLDATDAAASAVGSAIQNAFPFCVPAVLKQILGLLQADPAPPEFHFDFWGSPLDFGFSDWQGLADMTSWLSRIGFAVVLFANSRRFVYSGGVAGD